MDQSWRQSPLELSQIGGVQISGKRPGRTLMQATERPDSAMHQLVFAAMLRRERVHQRASREFGPMHPMPLQFLSVRGTLAETARDTAQARQRKSHLKGHWRESSQRSGPDD